MCNLVYERCRCRYIGIGRYWAYRPKYRHRPMSFIHRSLPIPMLILAIFKVFADYLIGGVLFQKMLNLRDAQPFSGSPRYPEDMLKKKFFASTNTRVVPRPASQYWRPKNEGRQIKLKLKFYYAN